MMFGALLFGAGLFAWTILEYVIHGLMSHRFRTFVTPLHNAHHREPNAVFTVGAWIPVAIATVAGLAFFGIVPGTIFLLGLLTGFIAYEAIHYRIHFARPANAFETRLRTRHLAHHLRSPNQIFGVTTPLWDRVLGSEPEPARMRELERAVAGIPPLTGETNWRRAFTMTILRH